MLVYAHKLTAHFQTLGLLADLHCVFASEFSLSPFVVILLIGEFRLVLQADQLSSCLLDGVKLAELQLLHGFMVPEEHGMFQVLLGLTLVKLLRRETNSFMHQRLHIFSSFIYLRRRSVM